MRETLVENTNAQNEKVDLKLQNWKDFIGICSFLIAVVSFVLKCYKYIYQKGYNEAIGLRGISIKMNNQEAIYDLLLYLGVACIIIFINYVSYILIRVRQVKTLGLFFWAQVVFAIILSSTGVRGGINAVFLEVIREKEYVKFVGLFVKTSAYVVLLNANGIIFAIYMRNKDKKILSNSKNININKSFIWFVGLCLLVEGAVTYFMGMSDGTNRKEYKYIVEIVADSQSSNETYKLEYGNDSIIIYPILYEDNESYIISYLCEKNNGDYYIDKNHQKIISKINVETYYTKDIFSLLR